MCCSSIGIGIKNGNIAMFWIENSNNIMEVFVTGILHTFGNNNINYHMCCSSIGIGIGDRNIIMLGTNII